MDAPTNPDTDDDRRVRDLVRGAELSERPRLGERTLRRVGDRGWERPNVFVSAALYQRYGLTDPWAPGGGREDPIKLGPVSLRLGEKRRQPAPHLKPKQPKAKKQADPLSKWRRPSSPGPSSSAPAPAPRPAAKPPPRPAAKPPPRPAARKPAAPPAAAAPTPGGEDAKAAFVPTPDRVERGMFRDKIKRGLKAPLPVRPDLGGPGGEPVVAKRSASARRKPPGPPAPPVPPVPSGRPARSSGGRSRAGRVRLGPGRRQATSAADPAAPLDLGGPEVLPLAPPPAPPAGSGFTGPPPEVVGEDPTPAAAPAPAPAPKVDRRPPGRPMGLDDLFGGSTEGRVRMRRRKPGADEDAGG